MLIQRAVVSIDGRSESQITQILHDIGGTAECKDGINFKNNNKYEYFN